MTLNELVGIAALIAIVLTNVLIIVLFANVILTIIRIKKEVKIFFKSGEFKKTIDRIFPGQQHDASDFDIEEIMPFEMDGWTVAFFIVEGATLFLYAIPEVISRKKEKDIEEAIIKRFPVVVATSYLNLNSKELDYLQKKFAHK